MTPCHVVGGRDTHYPTVRINGKTHRLHRLVYEQHHGPIPAGMDICHICDVKRCINPEHLFLGTRLDNVRDMWNKGREIKGEKHKLALLTDDAVREIRATPRGPRTIVQLAEKYGVSQAAIKHARYRQSWKHV